STAVVTPPAVSVKMPVVSASRRMPARISSSVTASIDPCERRARSSAYGPSAGLPMASDLAIVAGLTGLQTSRPSANAVATGEQPVAVVVVAADLDEVGAVDAGAEDLLLLEVGGDEDVGLQPERGAVGGHRVGQVAGRRAGEDLEAQLARPGRGHRHDAVLERVR